MCGLVACISKREYGFTSEDKTIFDTMLYTDAVRGVDSTGVFYVNRHGNLYAAKEATPAATFQSKSEYTKLMNDAYLNGRILVGHNRAATKGEKVDKNAHPFIEDHICLVHNGTLYNHKSIADTDVDSHAIAHGFVKEGYTKTLDKVLGAYALIWYDAKDKTLRIARNNDRPLWMLDTKESIYIASEADMLLWVVGRSLKEKLENPTYFATDKIYSWKVDSKQTKFYSEKYEKKVVAATTPIRSGTLPSTTTSLTTKPQLLFGNFRVGDRIEFTNDNVSIFDTKIKLEGILCSDETITVKGYVDTAKMSKSAETELVSCDFLVGTLSNVFTKNKDICLIVTDIKPDITVYTVDGRALTLDMFDSDLDTLYCDTCGDFIDAVDDSGLFWARIKQGKVSKLMCPKCVEKHPKLSKELENVI